MYSSTALITINVVCGSETVSLPATELPPPLYPRKSATSDPTVQFEFDPSAYFISSTVEDGRGLCPITRVEYTYSDDPNTIVPPSDDQLTLLDASTST